MKDDQLADILTYVRNAWGNQADGISPQEISDYRKKESARVAPWTEAEFLNLADKIRRMVSDLFLFDYHNATHDGVVSGEGTQELV